jgi:hypothetical protein
MLLENREGGGEKLSGIGFCQTDKRGLSKFN